MVIAPPAHYFTDRVTVTVRGERTATGWQAGDSRQLRCKFYGHGKTEWVDGVETRRGDAHFVAPLLPSEIRSVTRVEEVIVPPRNVGDRLPSPAFPYPSNTLYPPFDIFRADLVEHIDTYRGISVHVSDTVTFHDKTYVVYDVQEFRGTTPNNPSTIKVYLKDRR